jgi:hypothetical protein
MTMNRNAVVVGMLACILLVGFSSAVPAQESGRMNVKPGDEIFVCPCGEGCDCDAMSLKPASCSCGKTMIKAKVTKVDENFVYVDARATGFKRTGKYACACGPGCDCGTISQKPGKCSCGKDMKEVKIN